MSNRAEGVHRSVTYPLRVPEDSVVEIDGLLAFIPFFLVTLLYLRLRRGTLRVLIKSDGGTEYRAVKLLEFIGFILCALRVCLGHVEMALSVGELLYKQTV